MYHISRIYVAIGIYLCHVVDTIAWSLIVIAISVSGLDTIFVEFSYGSVAEIFEEFFGGLGLDGLTESQ